MSSRFSQNFVKDGLRGRPITRDIDWGVRVPLEGWEDKRLYVWFDARHGLFHRQHRMGAEHRQAG